MKFKKKKPTVWTFLHMTKNMSYEKYLGMYMWTGPDLLLAQH